MAPLSTLAFFLFFPNALAATALTTSTPTTTADDSTITTSFSWPFDYNLLLLAGFGVPPACQTSRGMFSVLPTIPPALAEYAMTAEDLCTVTPPAAIQTAVAEYRSRYNSFLSAYASAGEGLYDCLATDSESDWDLLTWGEELDCDEVQEVFYSVANWAVEVARYLATATAMATDELMITELGPIPTQDKGVASYVITGTQGVLEAEEIVSEVATGAETGSSGVSATATATATATGTSSEVTSKATSTAGSSAAATLITVTGGSGNIGASVAVVVGLVAGIVMM